MTKLNRLDRLAFFKRKAKDLYKEYKDSLEWGDDFPMSTLLSNLKEQFGENASLMSVQHVIAQAAGFKKWDELVQATPEQLQDARYDVEFEENNITFKTENGFIGGSKDILLPMARQFSAAHQDIDPCTEIKPLRDFSKEEQEKILAEQPIKREFTETVECLHCGRRFLFEESNVSRTQDFDYIVCKYTPEDCDGSLIDLIPTNELDGCGDSNVSDFSAGNGVILTVY